ncbi:MAG: hypothetical protein PSV36_06660 [Algoriphagus sp.]|nr:hypothetical protein [Algoriphagus sp.]
MRSRANDAVWRLDAGKLYVIGVISLREQISVSSVQSQYSVSVAARSHSIQ